MVSQSMEIFNCLFLQHKQWLVKEGYVVWAHAHYYAYVISIKFCINVCVLHEVKLALSI